MRTFPRSHFASRNSYSQLHIGIHAYFQNVCLNRPRILKPSKSVIDTHRMMIIPSCVSSSMANATPRSRDNPNSSSETPCHTPHQSSRDTKQP
ncbi:hypothetical protein VTI74DRAFT_2837 [Chaetomium olivicolor]